MFQIIIHIALAVSIVIAVLLQGSSAGLGSAFGGSSNYHTKRGLEKSLFYLTIALTLLFTLSSIGMLI